MTQTNPDTPTFDGLAAGYGQFRPDYPGDILQAIADRARLVEATAPLALDVGAGTGISTRALAKALGERWRVIGLEPSADMREAASGEAHNGAVIDYREGTSQRLPVADAKAGLILVAQALHWFDRPTFYTEAARALAPAGALAILYNDRDSTTPLIQAFETLMEVEVASYSRDYRDFDYVGELRAQNWGEKIEIREAHWHRDLTPEAFAGLMLSRANTKSYLERVGAKVATERVVTLARSHSEGGVVRLGYRTRVAMVVRGA